MIYDYILNEMNADELRNYAHHMNELAELRGQLVYSQNELISAYKHVLSCEQYRVETLNAFNHVQDKLGELTRNMEQKYDYAIPRPCCTESSKEMSEDAVYTAVQHARVDQ